MRPNPRRPTAREVAEHEDSSHAIFRAWCKVCNEGRGRGGQHRSEIKDFDAGDTEIPIVAFDYGFMSQEGSDTFPILVVRDSRYRFTAATCVEAKGPNLYAICFLVGVVRDLGFQRLIFKCDNEPAIKGLQ